MPVRSVVDPAGGMSGAHASRPFGLEFGEKLQQRIARLKSADLARRGSQLIQGALFGFEVGFNVAICGFDALVTEPERDDSDIDPGLKQVHGSCVPHEGALLAWRPGQDKSRWPS